jgi:hypothetical protein
MEFPLGPPGMLVLRPRVPQPQKESILHHSNRPAKAVVTS